MRLYCAGWGAVWQQQGASCHQKRAGGEASAAGGHFHAVGCVQTLCRRVNGRADFYQNRRRCTENVWFYDMQADGFSLDDKRTPVEQNDIPDIIARFAQLEEESERARTEQSFFVPKEEIVANGYNLAFNKYKQEEYILEEYPTTQQIIAELQELERQFAVEFAKLKEIL